MKMYVKRLEESAKLPDRKFPTDSGLDAYCHGFRKVFKVNEDGVSAEYEMHPEELKEITNSGSIVLMPGDRVMVGTGIAATCDTPGYEIQVRSRSGNAWKKGLIVLNGIGTIDDSYRGEICVIMINATSIPQTISVGDAICQLVVAPVELVTVEAVAELSETKRGAGGMGHTGN